MEEETNPLEEDVVSLEDTLESLKRNAKAVEVHFEEARKKFKEFHQNLAHESNGLQETPLQPRTRMMKWLTDRGLPEQTTFLDFFEAFVEEHKQENRVDISRRTFCLNKDACTLVGFKKENTILHLYEFFEKLPILYY